MVIRSCWPMVSTATSRSTGSTFSSEVTIASENPGGAVFTSAQITNSSYLKIEGIHVDHPTDGVRYTAIVEIDGNSNHVSFVNKRGEWLCR